VLTVLSPAKSLDYESPLPTRKHSQPEMLDQAEQLVKIMATKTPGELARLMSISAGLAETNFERFQDWERPFTTRSARPALLAFKGDVYLGLDAGATFSERDYTDAQKTLRILSGLYGVLRPLDLMLPYRLEMGTRLATPEGRDLYDFWGTSITEAVDLAIEASPGARALVNLASNEYFKSVRPERLAVPVVTPSFLDERNGSYKVISFFAKKARGAMAGWIIQNRVRPVAALQGFDRLGYRFDPDRSTRLRPVFCRPEGQG
jgi:cytoplasmic iron level regulating protein YaaA (DUF328/UPF0246 family)